MEAVGPTHLGAQSMMMGRDKGSTGSTQSEWRDHKNLLHKIKDPGEDLMH